MTICIESGDLHLLDLRTRMPFKYGIATMTHSPHAFVRVWVTVAGARAEGVAADHLPPKWFTKDPAKPIAEEVTEMVAVIEHALETAPGLSADSPFDVWQQLYAAQGRWGRSRRLPPLLTHFGTSLIERALIDAFCRATGQSFAQAVRTNQLGIRLGDIHSELAGRQPVDYLPAQAQTHIFARHTVGLADPLEECDIRPDERLDDGLPQSLRACIRSYGLSHFKIKISGVLDRDRHRLGRIAEVIEAEAGPDFAFTLDGNEQFHAADEFQNFWQELRRTPGLQDFWQHLLFVEQPLHRDVALKPGAMKDAADWKDRPPTIIDESDGELDSLPQALGLGYAGTSHKNCKGVFKGIANACLLAHLQRQRSGRRYVLSGEDLANIGPVALLQDLAAVATLGVASVERNGHHYFAGLSMFPAAVQRQVLDGHGDLYRRSRFGWPTLAIRGGSLRLDSVVAAPFGLAPRLDVEQFPSLAAWRKTKG
jgi:hypothetical protein